MSAKKTKHKSRKSLITKGNSTKCSPSNKQAKPDLTRYVKVDRLGKVSIYRRHKSYWLYFRDSGKTIRKKTDGNLNTARSTASQVNVHLGVCPSKAFSIKIFPLFLFSLLPFDENGVSGFVSHAFFVKFTG